MDSEIFVALLLHPRLWQFSIALEFQMNVENFHQKLMTTLAVCIATQKNINKKRNKKEMKLKTMLL